MWGVWGERDTGAGRSRAGEWKGDELDLVQALQGRPHLHRPLGDRVRNQRKVPAVTRAEGNNTVTTGCIHRPHGRAGMGGVHTHPNTSRVRLLRWENRLIGMDSGSAREGTAASTGPLSFSADRLVL